MLPTEVLDHVFSVAMSEYTPPNKTIRPAKFAGDLYPSDPVVLTAQVDDALQKAKSTNGNHVPHIKTLLVPHDNYRYAIQSMAAAYAQIDGLRYDLALFIAPTVDQFNRLAMSGYGFFETPLGNMELSDYVRNEFCDEDDDFFISEDGLPKGSSIEVQLPFIQRTLVQEKPIKIVPLLVGNQTIDLCNEAAAAAAEIMLSKNVLIVAANNFHAPKKNASLIEDYLKALEAQDYSALMRITILHGAALGTGLGTVAIAARVSAALGAKKFHVFAKEENHESDKLYLSACFSR
jgi:AmmeMemoRadiSam system protein B